MSRTITAKTTYVLRRGIRFYDTLVQHDGYSPVCDNLGASIMLPMGTKVCVAQFSTTYPKDRTSALMTTPVRGMGPVYGWVEVDDLCLLSEADVENIQPCFV